MNADENVEQQSPFVAFTVLKKIDTEHRKEINPRKRALQEAVKTTMVSHNETLHTEDGKNFFVLKSEKPLAKLNKKFKRLAYEKFQLKLQRQLIENEYDVLEKFIKETREQDAGAEPKMTVKHQHTRPAEAYF